MSDNIDPNLDLSLWETPSLKVTNTGSDDYGKFLIWNNGDVRYYEVTNSSADPTAFYSSIQSSKSNINKIIQSNNYDPNVLVQQMSEIQKGNEPPTPTPINTLTSTFGQYINAISQSNAPIVDQKPLPNSLSPAQLLYLKEDFELGWNIAHFPVEQQLDILRSVQKNLRNNLLTQALRSINKNGSKRISKTKQVRNSMLRQNRKASKQRQTQTNFQAEKLNNWQT